MRFRRLRRILSSFRRLRWKLTLSYTLVTVAPLAAMEMVAIVLFMVYTPSMFPINVIQTIQMLMAPQVRPFLEAPQPDLDGLGRWMKVVYTEGVNFGSGQGVPLGVMLGGECVAFVVVDEAGYLLSAIPADLGEPGEPFLPNAPAPLQAALAGERDIAHLHTRAPDRRLAIAAPVIGLEGQTLGALYLVADTPQFTIAGLIRPAIVFMGLSVVVLTVAVGLFGTLFGFFTARGLTRRLGALTDAADAWGQGDFSAVVQDTSSDEIGQLARQLNRMAEQVQNLLHSREQLATLEERNRLARDLHDSVKQQVFAATMTLGAAEALWEQDCEAARQKVAEALSLSQEAQRELTVLIRELRPAALEGKGLAAALQEHVEDWSRQTGIAAEVGVQGERPLPLEVEQVLFRVVQEALANVARHSGATRTDVTLSFTDEFATLTVADDGRGFDVAAAEGRGLGLRSMRERVKTLGGTLCVEGAETGTTVEASVPVELPGAPGVPGTLLEESCD